MGEGAGDVEHHGIGGWEFDGRMDLRLGAVGI